MGEPTRVMELRSVRGTGGGPEKTILFGAAKSDPTQFDVSVCYIRDARDEVFHIDRRASALGVRYVEVIERHSFDPAVVGRLRRLVVERGTEILHSHDYKTDLLCLLMARLEGVTPLTTVHGWSGDSWRETYVYYPAHKFILRFFPRVVAVSPVIREQLIQAGCRGERIRQILNGIDPLHFRRDANRVAEARAHYGVHDAEICVGSVGRLERGKRYDLLLEVFARVAADWPMRLLIAGEGAEREALQGLARRLGVEDRVTLVGLEQDVRRFYLALDIFVQSSYSEGTPNVVLEAMAMEVPIVATDVGGTAALSPDASHALLVPRDGAEAMAEAIRQVVRDPEGARRRVAASRRRVESDLSFDARTAAIETVYRELVATRRAR